MNIMNYTNNTLKYISQITYSALALSILISQGCLNYQGRWTGGVGIILAQIEDGVVIKETKSPFASQEAALLPGDMIVRVDESDVSNWPKENILNAISGPVGATVTITVLRNQKPITLEIERIMHKDAGKKTLNSILKANLPLASPASNNKPTLSSTKEESPSPASTQTETQAVVTSPTSQDADTSATTVTPTSPSAAGNAIVPADDVENDATIDNNSNPERDTEASEEETTDTSAHSPNQ